MLYISHLLTDEEMKRMVQDYGAGVESIDFSISDNLDDLSHSLENYQERLAKLGNPPLLLHGPFLDVNPSAYDSLVRKVTRKRFDQCYEAARVLGAKKIVFHSGMNPYVYYKEYWAEHVALFWREFMEGKKGVQIALENVFDEDWCLMRKVYERVDHPDFKLCLDIGHAHCYSPLDVREWAENLAPYISHVHIHDNCGDRDAHSGLGKGNLPWQEALQLLPRENGRTWTIECMKEEDVKACAEALRLHGKRAADLGES